MRSGGRRVAVRVSHGLARAFVVKIRLAGKPIESVLSFEGGGNEDNEKIITGEWQYVLKTKAAEVTASVSYYSDVHSVQVPIDVTVGLGL